MRRMPSLFLFAFRIGLHREASAISQSSFLCEDAFWTGLLLSIWLLMYFVISQPSVCCVWSSSSMTLDGMPCHAACISLYMSCRYKWGPEKNLPPHSCKIEVEGPDGQKKPRQEPFETLEDIYVPLSRTTAKDLDDTPGQKPSTADERRLHMF